MNSLLLKLFDIVPDFSLAQMFKSNTRIWITLLIVFILFAIGIFFIVKALNKNKQADDIDETFNLRK